MRRRFIWMVIASIGLTQVAVRAQSRPAGAPGEPETPGMKLLERARGMMEDLKLSDEQKQKVGAIVDKAKKELSDMRPDLETLAPRERIERVRDFFQQVKQDVETQLTDAQKQQFDTKVQEERARFQQRAGVPTTRPGAGGPPRGGPAEILERLRDNLAKIDLSDEQKAKIKKLLEDVRAKAQQIREQANGALEEAKPKMQELFQDTREKMRDILTPAQREKLQGLMMGPAGKDRPTTRPIRSGRPQAAAGEMMKGDDMMMSGEMGAGHTKQKIAASPPGAGKPTTFPALGQPAPGFELRKLDGSTAQLSSYKGHVLVLEFGSYTSPSFRQRVGAMEQLRRELGARAQFLIVYTREAHPKGQWDVERNKDEKVELAAHKTMDDRKAAATKARQELKLGRPILLDDMEDSATKAYGAGPDTVVVIGRDGTIAARQQWADPSGLRRLVEAALNAKPASQPALD